MVRRDSNASGLPLTCPLSFGTHTFPFHTFTDVQYQPVGINPSPRPSPGSSTSNTARQLLSAFAMYIFFSSSESARLGVLPASESGKSAVVKLQSPYGMRSRLRKPDCHFPALQKDTVHPSLTTFHSNAANVKSMKWILFQYLLQQFYLHPTTIRIIVFDPGSKGMHMPHDLAAIA